MSMPITASIPAQKPEAPDAGATKSTEKSGAVLPTQAEAHAQQNSAIIKSMIEVSISSHNEPLALLLKSAISGINDLLKPEFGDNAIQNAVSQDNTPEGTAGRIVSLSTGFFEAFKKQHPGEEGAAVLKNFMTTIRSGFERGYNEARDILQGMKVLSGDIASNIEKTHELVLKGYAAFEAAQSSSPAQTTSPSVTSDISKS